MECQSQIAAHIVPKQVSSCSCYLIQVVHRPLLSEDGSLSFLHQTRPLDVVWQIQSVVAEVEGEVVADRSLWPMHPFACFRMLWQHSSSILHLMLYTALQWEEPPWRNVAIFVRPMAELEDLHCCAEEGADTGR